MLVASCIFVKQCFKNVFIHRLECLGNFLDILSVFLELHLIRSYFQEAFMKTRVRQQVKSFFPQAFPLFSFRNLVSFWWASKLGFVLPDQAVKARRPGLDMILFYLLLQFLRLHCCRLFPFLLPGMAKIKRNETKTNSRITWCSEYYFHDQIRDDWLPCVKLATRQHCFFNRRGLSYS